MFRGPIVIAGNRAGADIPIGADERVADIAQMIGLGAMAAVCAPGA